jgi:hypothetical protein
MSSENLTAPLTEARRCAVCHTGRHSRNFELVEREGREPVLMCAACHARFGESASAPEPAEPARPVVSKPAKAPAKPKPTPEPQDRLKRALRELPPGEHSTGRIAKLAGLNTAKVLARLQALEAAGEVQQVGKHWSTGRPATDLEAAFDRLQARTGNLRIVRERERVS